VIDFENDLRRMLRRREPPRDLTSAVIARIGARTGPPRPRWNFAGFDWRRVVAAAAAVVVLGAGIDRYREYRRGLEAKREVMLALEITAEKIAVVQEKIEKLNHRSIGHDR
jgi:hypothetical protein